MCWSFPLSQRQFGMQCTEFFQAIMQARVHQTMLFASPESGVKVVFLSPGTVLTTLICNSQNPLNGL